MKVQDFIDDMFFVKGEFSVQSHYGCAQGVGISNSTLEGLKEEGLDIHYELQKDNEGQAYVRLDCHIFPYWTIKSATEEEYLSAVYDYYSKERAIRILDLRTRLLDNYYRKEEDGGIVYPQRKEIRYQWIAKYFLSSDCTKEELIAEVWGFIAKTYPTLIQTLRGMGIIKEEK